MKLQLEIMLYVVKKSWIWFGILFVLSSVAIILFKLDVNSSVLDDVEYLSIIGVPGIKNYDLKVFLIAIYQIFLLVYIIYTFYTYELKDAFASVVLRANERKWITYKIVTTLFSIIIFRVFYQLLTYYFFKDSVSFSLEYFINSILYHTLIGVLVITLLNFLNQKRMISYIILFLLMVLIFTYFNLLLVLLSVVILIILNTLLFRFKLYYKY